MSRILIIDDDYGLRTMLEQALDAAGHDVKTAPDGKEGLRIQRAEPADLILVDLFMPNKEGLETIQEIRREFPRVAIVAMSGGSTASTSMLSVALGMGANGILEKPFDAATLMSVITDALDSESQKA